MYEYFTYLCLFMQIDNPKYRLVVSDETMENVPMRICSWNDYNEKRPSIKEGDVIRVHRVLVY